MPTDANSKNSAAHCTCPGRRYPEWAGGRSAWTPTRTSSGCGSTTSPPPDEALLPSRAHTPSNELAPTPGLDGEAVRPNPVWVKPPKALLWFAALSTLAATGITWFSRLAIGRRLFSTGGPVDIAREHGLELDHVEFFASDGKRLHGWLYRAKRPRATILFFHGTSYSTVQMLSDPVHGRLFGRFLEELECDWFTFDYRGYGASEGTPSEGGVYRDAEAALSFLRGRGDIDMSRLVLYGFSMGTAIAVEMATRHATWGVILRAPFSSIRDISESRVPFTRYLHVLMPWLPGTRFDTRGKISRLRAPLLVMHGDRDSSVPIWMGRWVYELASSEKKRFVELRDTAHGDFPVDQILEAIGEFVESLDGPLVASDPPSRRWRAWDGRGDRAGERYTESVDSTTPVPAVPAADLLAGESARPPA
ncbi:MAG: alpha/beta fold hydrolase [Dehalococcoidia bacterium]|nr:alpha/beta fold hydrolase [Dehalococcoidia bacterium]